MADPIYPLINGVRASWGDIEFRIRNARNLGVTEISYSQEQEPQPVYGAGVKPIGRTRGQVKPEASMTMLKEEADLLIETLGDGYGEVSFDIGVQYRLDGLGVGKVHSDAILGVRITKIEQSPSVGSEALTCKISLSVMDVLLNGKSITKKAI